MEKQLWKPGNMIYPLPAVMVSVGDADGNTNIITVAWTGTICTNPAMAYISVRPERYSYEMIRSSGEFVINLTTKDPAGMWISGKRLGLQEEKRKNFAMHRQSWKALSISSVK